MCTFSSVSLTQDALDPNKRVNYTMGLVLGVDEFTQEQTYLMERGRLHNRGLHGYGTAHGLLVIPRRNSGGPEVVVTGGMALDPLGRHICVPIPQCAALDPWLARQQADGNLSPAETERSVYVVLCYRECETDLVPIPGGPCRSQDESMAASRIADDFELKLTLSPPAQVEEDAIRRFGDLLRRIVITAVPGEFATQMEVEALVCELAESMGSPPPSSPPDAGGPIRLHPDEAGDILRAAFKTWVTEVRPKLLGTGPCGAAAADACVLLAELQLELTLVDGVLHVVDDDETGLGITVVDEARPYLLTTRTLQEWLLAVQMGIEATEPRTFCTLSIAGGAPDEPVVRAWLHHPALLDVPVTAVVLFVDDVEVGLKSVIRVAPGVNVFDLGLGSPPGTALAGQSRVAVRFDAAAIVELDSPGRSLAEALAELDYAYLDRDDDALWAYLVPGQLALDDLLDVDAPAPADGQVLTCNKFGVWVAAPPVGVTDHGALTGLGDDDHKQYLRVQPSTRALIADLNAANHKITALAQAAANGEALPYGQPAGGDLSGTYPNPTVQGLQGNPVSAAAPSPDDVLTWDGKQWEPQKPQGGGSGLEADLTRIIALSWPHDGTTTLAFELDAKPVHGLAVAFAKATLGDKGQIMADSLRPAVFQVFIDEQLATGLIQRFGVPPARIVPILPDIDPGSGLIVKGTTDSNKTVSGALFLLDDKMLEPIRQHRLWIAIRGDFILDETGKRAIDAEHVRAELPTGDRPANADTGIQGGLFESWVNFKGQG